MEDLPEPSNQLDTVQIAEKFNHARTSDLETKGKLFYPIPPNKTMYVLLFRDPK